VVSDGSFEPAPVPFPLFLQADADRGAQESAKVAVAIGGDVPDGTDVALRLVTLGDAPRIVSTASAAAQAGRMRLVRQFDVAPGTYEVRAAAGQARPGGGGLVSIATCRLVVPDLTRGVLVLTPLVLGDAASAAGRGAGGRPFVFGPTALSPATTSRFERGKDLNVAFRVFNWSADTAKEPDLTAEYTFYQKTGERLVFFNRTKPQRLGADTLGETFDSAAGVLTAGMSVPLEPFPLGEFQLAVRVTDKALGRSEEQRVGFSVVP
jgi:hypothetical protein